MKNKSIIFLTLFVFALFQTAYIPSLLQLILPSTFWSFPISVDLLLIALVFLGFQRNLWQALAWACVMGVLARAFGLAWKGSVTSSYVFLVLFCSSIRHHILIRNFWTKFLVIASLTLLEAMFQLFLGGIFERTGDMFSGQGATVLTQMILNGVFAPLVFFMMMEIDFRTFTRGERAFQEVVFKREKRGRL